jgi:hypothetical protein
MDTGLYELCKKVYEATGWGDYDHTGRTEKHWYETVYVDPLTRDIEEQAKRIEPMSVYQRQMYFDNNDKMSAILRCPLYTSDYLLEKLRETESIDVVVGINRINEIQCYAKALNLMELHRDIKAFADTPLKSLLKLAIALDDAGVKL